MVAEGPGDNTTAPNAAVIRDELAEAARAGTLPERAYALYRADKDGVLLALNEIHRQGRVDVVHAYSLLKRFPPAVPDFFMMRHVFDKLLASLDASVEEVMRCVRALYQEAGQDLSAGEVFRSFRVFCERDRARAESALQLIEAKPQEYSELLANVLVAGAGHDRTYYATAALRLSDHEIPSIRSMALLSLRDMPFSIDDPILEQAMRRLESQSRAEESDTVLAALVIAALSLAKREPMLFDRVTPIITEALARGGAVTLHAGADSFGFDTSQLPDLLLSTLVSNMRRVSPLSAGTINSIDYGISGLLEKGKTDMAVGLLVDLLRKGIPMPAFDDAGRYIRANASVLSRVLIDWFSSAEPTLCQAIVVIIDTNRGEDVPLDIDGRAVSAMGSQASVFLARKAIGYLFHKPIAAASVLVALLRLPLEETSRIALTDLLTDALLLNYGGELRTFIDQLAASETGKARESLVSAQAANDAYVAGLRSVGNVPALHPSVRQRWEYQKRLSEEAAASYKAAESRSPLLSAIPKRILLYGKGSVDYVYSDGAQPRRIETPLIHFSMQVETPRMDVVDPVGLEIMLHRFKGETASP
jgi:hypothetical protein